MAYPFLLDLFATALETGPRPDARLSTVDQETIVPASVDDTFAFFSDATNLEKLTPGWLNFAIQTETPIAMKEGAEIDYTITLHGFPIPWKTRIDVWEPRVRFVDRQTAGPYLWWHHEHRFEPTSTGTRVIDHVEFVPRLALLTRRYVEKDVQKIFKFRQEKLQEIFRGNQA